MILLPALYLDGPVELFEENDASEGVRECDLSEGQAFVRLSENSRRETEGTPDHESHVAASRDAKRRELSRKLLRGEWLSSLSIQGDYVCSCGEPLEEALAFDSEHVLGGAAVHVLFRDFDDLNGEIAPEAAEVVLAACRCPAFQPPYGHDGGTPYHSNSKSWLVSLSGA